MATFAEEELDEDLIREARANSQHLLGTPMAHAFKNYGADRAKQAALAVLSRARHFGPIKEKCISVTVVDLGLGQDAPLPRAPFKA